MGNVRCLRGILRNTSETLVECDQRCEMLDNDDVGEVIFERAGVTRHEMTPAVVDRGDAQLAIAASLSSSDSCKPDEATDDDDGDPVDDDFVSDPVGSDMEASP